MLNKHKGIKHKLTFSSLGQNLPTNVPRMNYRCAEILSHSLAPNDLQGARKGLATVCNTNVVILYVCYDAEKFGNLALEFYFMLAELGVDQLTSPLDDFRPYPQLCCSYNLAPKSVTALQRIKENQA